MKTRTVFVAGWLLAAAGFASAQLPPMQQGVAERLAKSPRHAEWVTIGGAMGDKIDAWIVYPERSDKAPVVLVVHENMGLNDWARTVADQLAADGFIAIAPDMLSGKGPGGVSTRAMTVEQVREAHAGLKMPEVVSRLNAVATYGTSLPAATKEFGIVGFCWGGGVSFAYATEQPNLKAAVVYYGTSPATEAIAKIRAPVLGHYGGDDARVNATIPAAEAEMKRLGKPYEPILHAGAGHGFLRQQDGREGANMRATQAAWPKTVAFFKQHLESRMSMQAEQLPFIAAQVPAAAEDDCGDSCMLPAAQ